MGRVSEAYQKKLAKFKADQQRHVPKEPNPYWMVGLKAAWSSPHNRRRKRRAKEKARIKEVLAMARAALGYKPSRGSAGRPMSAAHKAKLHAARDRYFQTQREKKAIVKKCG
jgi:hypothetical protein